MYLNWSNYVHAKHYGSIAQNLTIICPTDLQVKEIYIIVSLLANVNFLVEMYNDAAIPEGYSSFYWAFNSSFYCSFYSSFYCPFYCAFYCHSTVTRACVGIGVCVFVFFKPSHVKPSPALPSLHVQV